MKLDDAHFSDFTDKNLNNSLHLYQNLRWNMVKLVVLLLCNSMIYSNRSPKIICFSAQINCWILLWIHQQRIIHVRILSFPSTQKNTEHNLLVHNWPGAKLVFPQNWTTPVLWPATSTLSPCRTSMPSHNKLLPEGVRLLKPAGQATVGHSWICELKQTFIVS